jgi:hypothetical protein
MKFFYFYIDQRRLFSNEEWNNYGDNHSYYYHYTSIANAINILKFKKIVALTPKRFNYGAGIFFTIHSPNLDDKSLIVNNYVHYVQRYIEKVECAFAIPRENIYAIKINNRQGRDVWQHKFDIDLTRTTYKLIARRNKFILDHYISMGLLDIS